MKNHAKIFIPFALALLIGSLTFAFAQTEKGNGAPPRPNRPEGFRPPPPPAFGTGLHPRMLAELNLNAAQKEQLEAIHFNSRDAAKEYFEKARAADEQLRTLIETGAFDEEQARKILQEKARAMIEMEVIRLRTDAAILNLLTAEQKTQLARLREKRPAFPSDGDFRPNER